MSPESTHKLMGFYTEALINTRRYTLVHSFCFFKLFPIGCIGLIHVLGVCYTLVHSFCFFKLFPIGCIGLIHVLGVCYTLVHGFCFFKLFPIGCTGLK